ncbi:MAG: hypothetical protein AAGE52_30715 [Myxococcota bacterium]
MRSAIAGGRPVLKIDEELNAVLPQLSARMRSALAAAAGRRVMDVLYDDDRSPVLAKEALALVTRFACGENVSSRAHEDVFRRIRQAQAQAAELQDVEFNYTLRVMVEAVATLTRGWEAARNVAHHLIDVAIYAGFNTSVAGSDQASADLAEAEEVAWLRAVLAEAQTLDDDAITPTLFVELGAVPPTWLSRWELPS